MTLEQIQNLTLKDVFIEVLGRVIDLSIVPQNTAVFTLHVDENLSFYERVILNPALVKPSLELLNTELEEYRAELLAQEQARLAEIARVEDIRARFNALVDVRDACASIDVEVINPPALLKLIIDTNNQQLLSDIETADANMAAKRQLQSNIENVRKVGAIAVKCCQHVIEVVAGYNITRELTSEQKDQMIAQFAPALQALQQYRPAQAKTLIQAISPDGVLVTQEMKDSVLEVYAHYGI